jgi:hypothetical protein
LTGDQPVREIAPVSSGWARTLRRYAEQALSELY